MAKKLSILLLLTICILSAYAKHVDEETAKTVANTFWNQNVLKGNNLKSGNTYTNITSLTEFTNIYIFNNNSGFVIVSADDAAKPILGYSQQATFDPENIPANAKNWILGYCNEIQYAIDNNIEAGEETREAWNNLRNGIGLAPKSSRSVSQMLTTTWNQAPYYNNLCPYDEENDERSVTGCVATAMAQIMKYWNWPARGTGSHSYTSDDHPEYGTMSANFGNTTYDWNNMPNALSSSSTSTQINAVATLMYHCGVAVEMMYSATGSGAYSISYDGYYEYCTENALKNYFGYKSSLYGLYRSYRYLDEYGDTLTWEMYSYDEWVSMLKEELNVARPILYTGAGPDGGHAFVFDGYDNNNLFHVNWGWGSWQDGYFSIDALEPAAGGIGGGSYQFNIDQTALFGVEPDYSCPSVSPQTLSFNANGGSASFTLTAGSISNNCTISSNASWLSLSRTTANGYGATTSITATATQNTSNAARYATITITQGSYTATVSVTQEYTQLYTITALPANQNQGTVTGGGSYAAGTTVTLRATPADGYDFFNWNDGNTNNPRSITVTGNANYIANFREISSVNTYTITVLSSNQSHGTTSGGGTYQEGTTVTISATPANGYEFTNWNDGNTSNPRTITVTENKTYIANFREISSVNTYTITVLSSNQSHGTASGGGTYQEGTTVTISATPANGYEFTNWNDGNTSNPRTITVTENKTYIATFQEISSINTYTITVLSSNENYGTVTGGGTYTEGTTVTISATPASGYEFTMWNDGNPSNPRTITVTENKTYIATFNEIAAVNTYTITVLSANESYGTVSGGGTYPEGSTVTISATPAEGYEFTMWNDGNPNSQRTITVTENKTYIATFNEIAAVNTYTITVLSANESYGTVSGGGTYPEGTTVTISAMPAEGFEFIMWNDGNPSNPRTITVTGNKTYIATFDEIAAVNTYTITVLSANESYGTVSGGGTYPEGSTVTISATPAESYEFIMWNDGNPNRQRSITVTRNATFIATFEMANNIEENSAPEISIFPNPASNLINITSTEEISHIEIVSTIGQTVMQINASGYEATINIGELANGMYFARIFTDDNNILSIIKLIKE